jgi:hypothetical protein
MEGDTSGELRFQRPLTDALEDLGKPSAPFVATLVDVGNRDLFQHRPFIPERNSPVTAARRAGERWYGLCPGCNRLDRFSLCGPTTCTQSGSRPPLQGYFASRGW